MSSANPLIPQAFSLALLRLDTPLPADLQHSVQQVGLAIARPDADTDDQILHLIDQSQPLHEQFNAAYDELKQHYQVQERTKGLMTGILPQPYWVQWAKFLPSVDSLMAHLGGSIAFPPSPTTTLTWENLTVSILTADDQVETARVLLKQVKSLPNHLIEGVQAFLLALQKTVIAIEAQDIRILAAIEKRPLTAEDLVYVVGMPLATLLPRLQSLWHRGYIERTTTNSLYLMFPQFRSQQRKHQTINPDAYLTLTATGRLFLRPVIAPSRSGVAIP